MYILFSPLNKVILFVLILFQGCGFTDSDQSEDSSSTPIAGHEVKRHDLSRVANFVGGIRPKERIEIRSRLDGVLETLEVEAGDYVEKDDLLASIDVSEIQAQYNRAASEMVWVEGRYERSKHLHEQGAVVKAELEALEAELNMIRDEVALWRIRLNHGKIYAPRSGMITGVHVRQGSSVSNQELIFNLADTSEFVISIKLSDKDVANLEVGHPAKISIDAFPEHQLVGQVRRIYPDQNALSKRTNVEIHLNTYPQDMIIRAGFVTRVSLNLESMQNIMAIPTEALLASEGEDIFVYVVEDDSLVKRSVQRDVTRRNLTVIKEGLEPGDIIVGTNPTNLREGMNVRITQWIE